MKLIHRIHLQGMRGALFQTNWLERLFLNRMIKHGRTNLIRCHFSSRLYWLHLPGGKFDVPVPNYKTRRATLQVQPLQTQQYQYHLGGCTCEDCKG